MRKALSCWPCVVVLLTAVLSREATASHAGRGVQELFQRVAKAQVTARPEKRDESACPADYSLCAATLNGNCCPSGYACATDSCYSTAPATSSACGKEGYFACPQSLAGCCPNGYICGQLDCTAPAGVTNSYTNCPNDYYLCPASYNYGCCHTGLGCGLNACYSTEPSTYIVTSTVTTTSAGQTITTTQIATTIATPTPPAGLPTNSNVAAKFIPSTVPKASSSAAASSGGGLTSSQLGGIVGGVVALLLIVITAALLIIRHLRKVVEVVESRKETSTGNRTKSQAEMAQQYGAQLHVPAIDVDEMSLDPLMMTNNSAVPTPSGRHRSDSEFSSSQAGTPFGNPSGGSSGDVRHLSMDSSAPNGYFDIPRVQNMPGRHSISTAPVRSSTDSNGTAAQFQGYYQQQHGRHWSNASELSTTSSDAGGVASPLIAELSPDGVLGELPGVDGETSPHGGRSRSGSTTSPRPSLQAARRRSDPRTDNLAGFTFATAQPLDVVNESTEILHGYYGPRDAQAGQTAAGLDANHDLSSPLGPRFPGGPPPAGPQSPQTPPQPHP